MSEHTKTPWALFDAGDFIYINEKDGPGFICSVNVVSHHAEKCRANARHIVHCVNNHERLVEALRDTQKLLDNLQEHACACNFFTSEDHKCGVCKSADDNRTLLATLEAEKGGEL